MKVTRKQVAERANVSAQTVSYVMNKTRKFSQEIEDRVNQAIKELNYHPNVAARSLVTKKSYSVSFIVHDITNPIYNEIMLGFQEAAREKDYIVSICDAHKDINNYVTNLIARDIEGVFIYVLANYNDIGFIETFINNNVKVVLGNEFPLNDKKISDKVSIIEVDHQKGIEQIIDYLNSLGHKEIVYLSGLDKKQSFDKRYSAFKQYYQKIFDKEPIIIENDAPFETTVEVGYKLAEKLINSHIKYTAVITTNDLMAYGALEAFLNHGICVPKDVSLIGIDDLMFSKYTNPSLTTLGYNKKEYGEMVFNSLYRQINGTPENNIKVETFVVKRGSCHEIKIDNKK